ncbi:xanthine dehydrogenase family protein molybdopterin-binding subunit [Cellvibrio sp. NN19]|uniref:xanthine dehydrogenase family protein molybdopterin-binding subunit n=1 Tax=Cellvibrio chitinivorans TaxID=3102792 RepID=UPI002B4135E7|nr:molybdopterin cofactor-binding domain-containing protein [Cellvibrio sp. NN19]
MKESTNSTASMSAFNRRDFLKGIIASGLALYIPLSSEATAEEQQSVKLYGGDAMPGGVKDDPRIFLTISESGEIVILCPRAEMGQGIRTSWAMVIADELGADINRVTVLQAPGDETKYGNQNTDGSRSMRHHFQALRKIGASARTMLVEEAASRWKTDSTKIRVESHKLHHQDIEKSFEFGELAKAASLRKLPSQSSLVFRSSKDFKYVGQARIGLVDNNDITTGVAKYGIDAIVDEMVFAVVARPPVFGGSVESYDASDALKIAGVLKVVPIPPSSIPSGFQPLGGVAVVAETTYAAIKGREALKIKWNDGVNGNYDSIEYRKNLERLSLKPGKVVRDDGNVDEEFERSDRKLSASYYLPHLAHAPMEPPTATARFKKGKCEVWCSVQAPEAVRTDISKRFGLSLDDVIVHTLLLGGGFGRKSKPDFASEAAIISHALQGRAVKLTFTREDDIQNGFYHTVSVERLEATLDDKGKVTAWLHRTLAPSITSIFTKDPKHEAAFELGQGAVDMPFAIPNVRVENPEAQAHTRIGWFRSVSNIPHAFAIQSFVAELAHEAGKDPKDYLLELVGPDRIAFADKWNEMWNYGENPKLYPLETSRLRGVVERAAKEASWGKPLPPRHGLGIAVHRSFLSYAAIVVHVQVSDKGEVNIPRVDVAFDCGPVINPDRVRSQLEGAVIQGISLATLGEITFKNGRVEQSNFHNYELTRMHVSPREIHTHLIEQSSYDKPLGGVGEPGLPPVAPALVNAIFAATGKRIRSLPIKTDDLKVT